MRFPITLSINNERELEALHHALDVQNDIENDMVLEDSGLYSPAGENITLTSAQAKEARDATGDRVDRLMAIVVLRERLSQLR